MNNTQLKYKSTMTKLGAILLIFVGFFDIFFAVYFALPIYLLPEPVATIVDSIVYDIAYLSAFMVPVAFVPLFFKGDERQPMRLEPKAPKNTFALVFIGVGFTYAFSIINSIAVTSIFGDNTVEELFTYPQTFMSDTDVILQFITIAIVPAFCEEFLFRGVIASKLMPYGKSTAVVVSAICFGLMHRNFYQFLYTTVAGLILGAVYVATDSIWPSTIIHMINNALSVLQTVMYERFNEDYAYLLWIVIEAAVVILGVVAFACIIRCRKTENAEKTSIFGKPLRATANDMGFTANANLEAKDAVKAFLVPTMLIFVIYQIVSAILSFYASTVTL